MNWKRLIGLTAILVFALSFIADSSQARRRVRTFGGSVGTEESPDKPKESKGDEKPFSELTKDKVVIEGLFTFYQDTTDESWLMAIGPEQIGPTYLCNLTRSQSAGAFYDHSSMGPTYPFYFKRVGRQIMMLERNVRFRADTAAALGKAVHRGVSDHLVASAKIISKPDDSSGAVLIKADDLFVWDIQNVNYFVGQRGKTGLSLDKSNSYFETIKSFPQNSEIDVRLHYKTNKPIPNRATMQNPYSLFHLYHFSLSTIPESDYVPRYGDDRIGHFMTMYQDYTNLDTESPYVRYIDRWHLKKKDPDARLSEPVEPIVFWVENTVPEEYRQAVAEGIEFWNPSFEKIGFKNAVVAKQMPDDAEWDPADVRYNVVRWMVNPGAAYAVGPSRANPFTGQIYDADIRFSADWVRYMYNQVERFIEPVSFTGRSQIQEDPLLSPEALSVADGPYCNYAREAAEQAAFGMAYISSVTYDDLADKDSVMQEYVHSYLREIIAHEVGHTLGFRHNFKASTIYTQEQLNDPEFTAKHSTSGTIMDYLPPNIAGPDQPQGQFYAAVPGPFDDWMVEYAYADFGAQSPDDEVEELEEIASRAGEPELIYGTDEDAFGWSTRSIDPYCNLHDHGADPLGYAIHRVNLTRHLWHNEMDQFEKPGERYQEIYNAFVQGWRPYSEMALIASKYVGSLTRSNHHIGDAGGTAPFAVVPADEQRRAVQALREYLFAADEFTLPAGLLNRLQPERLPDFNWTAMQRPVDYPIHQRVLGIQMTAINRLYSSDVIGRLLNNVQRFGPDEDPYTMHEMFTEVRRSIWGEIVAPEDVNSFRRQLQLAHLNKVIDIFLSPASKYPADARTLAANDLDILKDAARKAVASGRLDQMSHAHFKQVIRRIEAAESASLEFTETAKKS